MSILSELKRRKVIKVSVTYVILAWVVAQVLQLVFESFGTPDWAIKTVLVLLVTGFPFALFFSWVYELTPEGLKREKKVDRRKPITLQTMEQIKGAADAERQLNLLIYKSRCKEPANWELVNSILASSTRNNPANGITGVLVATETQFLQVLEGEFKSVNATFERIARDSRHDQMQLISFTRINERKFRDWSMHGIGLFDLNRELLDMLCRKFGEDNGNVRLPSTPEKVMDLLNILMFEDLPQQPPE